MTDPVRFGGIFWYQRRGQRTPPNMKEDITMEDRKFCQCCAMPLDKPEDAGSEADGTH